MKMNQRVYGVVAIKSVMANWNADMTGNPKSTLAGDIFGSDKAFKYPIKKMWELQGEKVLYIKKYKIGISKKKTKHEIIQPNTLEESYIDIFGEFDKKSNLKDVIKNLFSTLDVENFGATFAVGDCNISITGAVQVGQGYNKFKNSNVEVIDILSPFKNSNEDSEDNAASSMGKKVVTDEAHYFYPFSVNPDNYNDYTKLGIDGFEGYTQEAFERFKHGCLYAATAYNTNSKAGCENEFAIFIYCKPESQLYIANLDSYIDFSNDNGNVSIDISRIGELLRNKYDQIDKIEVYYNDLGVAIKTGEIKCTVNSLY